MVAWRIILVALGNCPGWPGEFQGSRIETIQNLPNVRFFLLSLLTYVSKMRIQRYLCREVDGIWQYRIGGNLTIFDKDHDAAEEGQSQTEAFATIAMYSWWQLGEIECVPNLMEFGNLTIFDKDHDTAEEGRPRGLPEVKFLQSTMGVRYDCSRARVPKRNNIFLEGGWKLVMHITVALQNFKFGMRIQSR